MFEIQKNQSLTIGNCLAEGARGGETPQECAVREIYQELGLKIKADDLKVIEQQERFNHTLTFFRIELPSLKKLKKEGDEREEIKVFKTLMEIATIPDLFPNHRNIVQKASLFK